ncbi:MAG: hypothetical protein KDH96_07380 [Candidatus Riesia sp.]|nr:hypothetical protein [Candidatus Riesia sp.]
MKIFLVTNKFEGHGFSLHSYIIRENDDLFKPFLYDNPYAGTWFINEEIEVISSNLNHFL